MGNEQSTIGKKKQDQLVGTTIDERYKVVSVVGHGATTSVYKAYDTQLNRDVAIKILHTHSTASEMTVRRFEQECKTLAILKHANIVGQYDSAVSEGGQPYLVMEYLEGSSLKQLIEEKGALSVIEALHIFIEACAGLAAAHEKGVVHRDMKPANIMVTKNKHGKQVVKILDFGVAKLLIQGETFQTKTQTGEMLGTLLYMSPEQCLDQDLDGRADVYSLGCVMYEALTGKPPICGRTAFETMNKHLSEKPEKLANVRPDLQFPARLEKILQKAVEKDPLQRFQKITDLEAQLKELVDMLEKNPAAAPIQQHAPTPAPKIKLVIHEEEEPPPDLSPFFAEPPTPQPAPKLEKDRSREGTVTFIAGEAQEGVAWRRIYEEQLQAYAITDQEILEEERRLTRRYLNLKEMETFALSRFEAMDKNGDGFISKDELAAVLNKKGLLWKDSTFVSFLLHHLDEIRAVQHSVSEQWPKSPSGISRQDITEYFRNF